MRCFSISNLIGIPNLTIAGRRAAITTVSRSDHFGVA